MPLFGTRDVTAEAQGAAVADNLAVDGWDLPGANILQAIVEIDDRDAQSLIPIGLHPTYPGTAHFLTIRAPQSPVGPFTLAVVRLGCRAGGFQRSYTTRAYCDSGAATAALRSRWGFDVYEADVRLRARADRMSGIVALDGRTILDYALVEPLLLSPTDIRYVDTLNLARVDRDGQLVPRLVQVDAVYHVSSALRGGIEIASFDHAAWRAEGVDPVWDIAASYTACDLTFGPVRFLLDPHRGPFDGGLERLSDAVPVRSSPH
jgi:hypothetical protein